SVSCESLAPGSRQPWRKPGADRLKSGRSRDPLITSEGRRILSTGGKEERPKPRRSYRMTRNLDCKACNCGVHMRESSPNPCRKTTGSPCPADPKKSSPCFTRNQPC